MANHYLFTRQTISDLTLVINDKRDEFGDLKTLSLKKRGKITYDFVLDAHEIGEYCFPIDVHKSSYTLNEFEKIVDSQIAYNDIFKLHHSRPIIFVEYEKELEGTFDYFRSLRENIKNETSSELFKELWENFLNVSYDSAPDVKFNDFALALKLAYLSFGVERLAEIFPKLDFESTYDNDDLLDPLISYQPNKTNIESIYRKVKNQFGSAGEKSLKRDITSIDKVYFLNKYFINHSIDRRVIYFSSALRTKHILEVFKEDKGVGKSNYCEFYPWRTPIQIYTYLIMRALDDGNSFIKTEETINNLLGLQSQIRDLVDFEQRIGERFFKPQQKSDEVRETLGIKRTNYVRKIETIEGFKLVDIASLSGINKEKSKDKIDRNLKKYSPDLRDEITDFFLETINLTPENIGKENDVGSLLIQLQTDMKLSDVIPVEYASNDDIITNCYDAFPFLLYTENEDLKAIIKSLYEYWTDYYFKTQRRATNTFDKYKILSILNDFLSLDKELTTRNHEYYTVSAMLHLINSNKSSDASARKYIEKLGELDKVANNLNLLYIKATVLRRTGDYVESINVCNEYRNQDFRFGYCRALALIGLVYEKQKNFQGREDQINEAISDLIKTFETLADSSFDHKENFQAAVCSDIVYLAALYFHNSEEEKHLEVKSSYIETAETYLEKLKELKPKNGWDFLFPDFYHSEAFFEYTTIDAYIKTRQSDKFRITPKESWEKRLKSATKDIRKAIEFSIVHKKTKFYEELKEKLIALKNKL